MEPDAYWPTPLNKYALSQQTGTNLFFLLHNFTDRRGVLTVDLSSDMSLAFIPYFLAYFPTLCDLALLQILFSCVVNILTCNKDSHLGRSITKQQL